jgi:rifampicin phosphotransferase
METHPPLISSRRPRDVQPSTEARPDLVDLADAAAVDGSLVGAKAANLARAGRAGLPVLPGAVLTTAWDRSGWSHPSRLDRAEAARHAWHTVSDDGDRPLVVRSSSTNEDGGTSSMAGVFTSVLDVTTWAGFVEAVDQVLESGRVADVADARMAVLVQPQLTPRWGGVLFGADPVSGRTDRLLVSAVEGGPDRLVSGLDDGWTAMLTPRGRVVEDRGAAGAVALPRTVLRDLAKLAARAAAAFDGPQDIEWAVDHDGSVWLLQSRPITTPTGKPGGPVLGTGPVAETFPDPLSPLETDLWMAPLGEGLEQALLLTGAASPRALRRSAVVRSIDGWAVADLDHLGVAPVRHRVLRKLDPRPPARRVRAAWRTGRLSRALPALSRDVVEQVDRDLAAVPRLDELSNAELLAVLDNGRTALRALHGYEALAGMLLGDHGDGATAAALALSALAEARAEGVDLAELVETHPVVLALSPPSIGGEPEFGAGPSAVIDLRSGPATAGPAVGPAQPAAPDPASDEAVVREALRLRARWVQELTARAAWLLGHRLVCVGVLADQRAVRRLGLDELRSAVRTRIIPVDLDARTDPAVSPPRALPAQFRLTPDNTPVAVAPPTAAPGGVGAGGGSGTGPVHIGDDPPAGAVLVVPHLDPRLAAVVSRLGGLVAETGSPLSHLAILAREHGVPTVVGHAGATERYRPGQVLAVDGTIGSVRVVEEGKVPDEPDDGEVSVSRVIVLPHRRRLGLPGSDEGGAGSDDQAGDDIGTNVVHELPVRRNGGAVTPIGVRR